MGRIIRDGAAAPNTGIPGIIAGYGKERVIHSEAAGFVYGLVRIGDSVKKGQPMAVLTKTLLPDGMAATAAMGLPVPASLTGLVRGLIRDAIMRLRDSRLPILIRGRVNITTALPFPIRRAAWAVPC